jgi:hypothetical protein
MRDDIINKTNIYVSDICRSGGEETDRPPEDKKRQRSVYQEYGDYLIKR